MDVREPDMRSPGERLAALRVALAARGSPGEPRVERTAPLPVVRCRSARLRRLVERWVPRGLRGSRLDPGRPGAVGLALLAVVGAVPVGLAVWQDRPVPETPPSLVVVGADERPGAPPPPSPAPAGRGSGVLVVSVVGKVHKPGLVRLPDGSRVADAIGKAGGPLPKADLATVNLARRVVDGEQIAVGVPQPPGSSEPVPPSGAPGGGPPPGAGSVPGGKVDLNRATVQQLDTLPGVGPVTAQRILDWRVRHGRFTAVEQLREVEGIGERRFGQLKGLVSW
jgi:competence protein ComEA